MTARKTAPRLKSGRKSLFSDEYYDQIQNYCLLGVTLPQLAEFLHTNVPSLQKWIASDPAFKSAISAGREIADSQVAKSLFQRAVGCSIKETHIAVIEGRVVQTQVTKNYPPDTTAAFTWLKCRVPDKWRDRMPDGSALTPDEVALEAQRVIAAAMATQQRGAAAEPAPAQASAPDVAE